MLTLARRILSNDLQETRDIMITGTNSIQQVPDSSHLITITEFRAHSSSHVTDALSCPVSHLRNVHEKPYDEQYDVYYSLVRTRDPILFPV